MNIKTYTVDIDSLEECQKLLCTLKCNIGEIKKRDPDFISKNDKVRQIFNLCVEIYETDISSIYNHLQLDEERKYYVYAHCEPGFNIAIKKEGRSTFGATLGLKHMPFYFGKGTDNRAYELDRN